MRISDFSASFSQNDKTNANPKKGTLNHIKDLYPRPAKRDQAMLDRATPNIHKAATFPMIFLYLDSLPICLSESYMSASSAHDKNDAANANNISATKNHQKLCQNP